MTLPTTFDDLRLLLDALRLLLSGYSVFRQPKGQRNAEAQKEERAIGQAIETAEREIKAPGADSQRVAQGLEERLQVELGAKAKDAIIQRALGIMAFAKPYEVESFRYYKVLTELLGAARVFFLTNNVFTLRGEAEDGGRILPLRKFGTALQGLLVRSRYFGPILRADPDVSDVSIVEVIATLRTQSEGSKIVVFVNTRNSDHMGHTYTKRFLWGLELVAGQEVNRIGFRVERSPQFYVSHDFDLRITVEEFQELALAVVADLTDYANELANEERNFRDEIGPALGQILTAIQNRSMNKPG